MSNDEEEQKRAFELIHAIRNSSGETPPLFVNRVVASEHAQRLLHDISVAYADALTGVELKPNVKSFDLNLGGFRVVCDEKLNSPESLEQGQLVVNVTVPTSLVRLVIEQGSVNRTAIIRARLLSLYLRRFERMRAKSYFREDQIDRVGSDPVRGLMSRIRLFMPRTPDEERNMDLAAVYMKLARNYRRDARKGN